MQKTCGACGNTSEYPPNTPVAEQICYVCLEEDTEYEAGVPTDLLELHQILEWQRAVEERKKSS